MGSCARNAPVATSVAMIVAVVTLRFAGILKEPLMLPPASEVGGGSSRGSDVAPEYRMSLTAVPSGSQFVPVKAMLLVLLTPAVAEAITVAEAVTVAGAVADADAVGVADTAAVADATGVAEALLLSLTPEGRVSERVGIPALFCPGVAKTV